MPIPQTPSSNTIAFIGGGTSPGGTTQAAIETFEANGLHALVAKAIHTATERGKQLSAAND